MENKSNNSEKLTLHSTSNKIKRPQNAFMLYANDTRKRLAEEHPNYNNKEISCLLGKRWTNESVKVKEEYHKKASQLALLHKQRYPDYIYSPRLARERKMEKKKQKMERAMIPKEERKTPEMVRGNGMKPHENQNEEVPISEYMPNNPHYCLESSNSPEFSVDGDVEELDIHDQATNDLSSSEMAYKSHMRPERRFFSAGSDFHLDSCTCCIPLCKKPESSSPFPRTLQHLPATSLPSCSSTKHSAGSKSSFCNSPFVCEIKCCCSYGCNRPSFEHFHNPRMPFRRNSINGLHHKFNVNMKHSQECENESSPNRRYNYEEQDKSPEDTESFVPPTPCCSSKRSKLCFGYFDHSGKFYHIKPTAGFHPRFNVNANSSQTSENETVVRNSESDAYFSHSYEKECLPVSRADNSRYEREERGNSPEDTGTFDNTTPCFSSKCSRPCFGYFDSNHMPYHSNSNAGFQSKLNATMKTSQASQNEAPVQSFESDACSSHSCEKERLLVSKQQKSNYEEQDKSPEDTESFVYTAPCFSCKFYRPHFEYFNNPRMPYHRNFTAGFNSQLNTNLENSHVFEKEGVVQNPESDAYFSQPCEKERLVVSRQNSSRCAVGPYSQHVVSSESHLQASQCLPNFTDPKSNDEKSSCSSDLSIDSGKNASEENENEYKNSKCE